jgi:hypothetical protein
MARYPGNDWLAEGWPVAFRKRCPYRRRYRPLSVQRIGRSTRDDLNIAHQECMKPENLTTTCEPAAVVKLHGLSGKLVIGFPIQAD